MSNDLVYGRNLPVLGHRMGRREAFRIDRPPGNDDRASVEAARWLVALEDDPGDGALRDRIAAWRAANPANEAAWATPPMSGASWHRAVPRRAKAYVRQPEALAAGTPGGARCGGRIGGLLFPSWPRPEFSLPGRSGHGRG